MLRCVTMLLAYSLAELIANVPHGIPAIVFNSVGSLYVIINHMHATPRLLLSLVVWLGCRCRLRHAVA